VDDRAARIGKNEALFRELNERVKDVNASFGELSHAEFVCECADRDCVELVTLPLDEYERIRADATTFFVKDGHEEPYVESVVSVGEGYFVVRKHAGTPAVIAAETDPRS
jgi:hypothetical protein